MTCGIGKKTQRGARVQNFRPWETKITEIQQFQDRAHKRKKNVCIFFLILNNFCLKNQFELIQKA